MKFNNDEKQINKKRPNKYMQHTAALQLHETKTQFKQEIEKVHNYTWGLQNYQQFIEQLDQKKQRCRIVDLTQSVNQI